MFSGFLYASGRKKIRLLLVKSVLTVKNASREFLAQYGPLAGTISRLLEYKVYS